MKFGLVVSTYRGNFSFLLYGSNFLLKVFLQDFLIALEYFPFHFECT